MHNEFFTKYLKYTGQSEAPECFHFWTAVATLASLAGRRFRLVRGHYELSAMHYIVLVSGSGVARKTTAMKAGTKLLARLTEQLHEGGMDSGMPVMCEDITYAALIQLMGGQNFRGMEFLPEIGEFGSRPVLMRLDELTKTIKANDSEDDLVDALTSLYTADRGERWTKITKTQGVDVVEAPTVNILASTQIRRITNAINSAVYFSGFVGRCIFVYGPDARGRIPNPTVDQDAKAWVEERLAAIANAPARDLTLSPEAEAYYADWYMGLDFTSDESGFVARIPDHVFKLAMVFAISDLRGEITLEDFKTALAHVEKIHAEMGQIFRFMKHTDERNGVRQVEALVQGANGGGMTKSRIVNAMVRHLKAADLTSILDDLEKADIIVKTKVQRKGPGVKPTLYTHRDFVEGGIVEFSG
tara:strand:+ start:2678 stop:3922 length:1245 start_codon:yes stop_codon:yes gene_type:complete